MRPLGIQLRDGSRWVVRNGGAIPPASENSVVLYYCKSGCGEQDVLVGGPELATGPWIDTSGATWTIRRGQLGDDKVGTKASVAPIATAWFLHTSLR